MGRALVLNASESPLAVVAARRAVVMVLKEKADVILSNGMVFHSARLTIEGKEIADALHVPRQAVLEKNGKTHVYVKVGDRFEQREVKVENFTESRAVIAGLSEGTEVALTDPTVARPTSNSSSPTLTAAGGSR